MVALFPTSILARTGDNSKLLDLVCKRLLGRVLPQVHMVKVDTIQPIASVVIAKGSCNLLSISRIVRSSPVYVASFHLNFYGLRMMSTFRANEV